MKRFWWHSSSDRTGWRGWLQRRFWLHRRSDTKRARFSCLSVEWTIPCGHCGWSVTFGGGDSGRNFGMTVAVPLLFTLYVTVENAFRNQLFAHDFDRGSDREIGCYFFQWAFWYHIWVGRMASYSRGYPWCRWWRQGSFHFANLLGKQTYTSEVIRDGLQIHVWMPEGVYHGTAKYTRATWKRPLWFRRVRLYTDVSIPKGIPFAGKGENSWDCGDDGLFGYSGEGHDLSAAAQKGAEIVMESRRRYGSPSDAAIREALA